MEVERIGELLELPSDRVLTGEGASEAAVKAARGPQILHLATHGFFLADLPRAAPPDPARSITQANFVPQGRIDDPLLRSGLALSGFNERSEAADANDGVLTALEVTGLNLWGTQIVTLSACETGVGEVRNGEGVFGLRRALVLAGSQTQVMSLWKVADDPTQQMMVSWYGQIKDGVGRAEAMRKIQLAAIEGDALPETQAQLAARGVAIAGPEQSADPRLSGTRHPYYWASFIVSGQTGPVAGLGSSVQ